MNSLRDAESNSCVLRGSNVSSLRVFANLLVEVPRRLRILSRRR